jgi:hypothetical protein
MLKFSASVRPLLSLICYCITEAVVKWYTARILLYLICYCIHLLLYSCLHLSAHIHICARALSLSCARAHTRILPFVSGVYHLEHG